MAKNKDIIVTTSWDDGHVLDIKLSELLNKYSIKGTFYVSPLNNEFDKEKLLNDKQIVDLAKNHEIGAHTITHPLLTKVNEITAEKEIFISKVYLEFLLNKEITSFCFPAGYYNTKIKDIVKKCNFVFSRTTKRFSKETKDLLEADTTVHAYRHWSDLFKILKTVGLRKFLKAYFNWDELAITMFEDIKEEGGVFHLWGHSWEIEKNKDWKRLERVLEYISKAENVRFVTNSELAYE